MLDKEREIFKREFIKHYNIINQNKLKKRVDNANIRIKNENYYAGGGCSYVLNKITIRVDHRNVIYHELMHKMSIKEYGSGIMGFHNYKKNIGCGFNEGYTEKLTIDFFKKYYKHYAYEREKNISIIIEKIIGKNKMKLLYFNSGFKVLIKLLSKYKSKDEILTILKDIDLYSKLVNYYIYEDKKEFKNNLKIYLIEKQLFYELTSLYNNYLLIVSQDKGYIDNELQIINELLNNETFIYYNSKNNSIKTLKKER